MTCGAEIYQGGKATTKGGTGKGKARWREQVRESHGEGKNCGEKKGMNKNMGGKCEGMNKGRKARWRDDQGKGRHGEGMNKAGERHGEGINKGGNGTVKGWTRIGKHGEGIIKGRNQGKALWRDEQGGGGEAVSAYIPSSIFTRIKFLVSDFRHASKCSETRRTGTKNRDVWCREMTKMLVLQLPYHNNWDFTKFTGTALPHHLLSGSTLYRNQELANELTQWRCHVPPCVYSCSPQGW